MRDGHLMYNDEIRMEDIIRERDKESNLHLKYIHDIKSILKSIKVKIGSYLRCCYCKCCRQCISLYLNSAKKEEDQ